SDPRGTVSIRNPRISPDGRYVGYERDDIVFVTAIDGSGIPTNITKGFGAFPRWTRNGSELFWTTFGGSILHANTSLQPIFSTIGQSQEAGIMGSVVPYFDVFNDGQRAIVADLVEDPFAADSSNAANVQLNFVINWFEELKERAPGTHN
ncbi:MAG: hypothetical protein IH853_10385, partial [Bacteroidetes bacterium]|nr:hypothetical protein [Bacteroidota bacterium]